MAEIKLYSLLRTLSVYELNRFGKFLRSPYFNEDGRLARCFAFVAPFFKRQTAPPEHKTVWKAVNGMKAFNSLKFARLYSDLAKKLDEFLVHDIIRLNEPDKLQSITAIYNDRKLTGLFEPAWNNANISHKKQPYRDAGFYLREFELEVAFNTNLELQNLRSTEKNITQTLCALDRFYFIQKLNYLAALLHYKKFLSTQGEVVLAREILSYFKNNPPDIPAIAINYRIVLSLMEPGEERHFVEMRRLLAEHVALFSKSTARNFYAFSINFCIRQINFGNLAYISELLALYKEMLQKDLMTDEQGALSQFDYKNIVTVALRAHEVNWAEEFIREHKKKLPVADRQNAYTFNMARIHFYRRHFDKVLSLLQDVVYTDIFYQLDSKTTLMKSYYELGEYLPLMALKESFRILLRRKKVISEQNRVNYMNFIRFTMKLYRIDVKDTKKFAELSKNITAATNVADKTWLMEKLAELSPAN